MFNTKVSFKVFFVSILIDYIPRDQQIVVTMWWLYMGGDAFRQREPGQTPYFLATWLRRG